MQKIILPCLSCIILWYWMQSFLLAPLRETAAVMAHLDPTEIIAVPYPLDRLAWFVGLTVTFCWLIMLSSWSHPRVMLRHMSHLLQGTLVSFVAILLCGADPWNNVIHTLGSALYLTNLALVMHPWSDTDLKSSFAESMNHYLDGNDSMTCSRFYGTVFGTIPFQVLNILDWGSQVQRWPLPILIGSTYGWIGGTLVGIMVSHGRTQIANASGTQEGNVTKKPS